MELGLVYFGKRYYAPALGRWISADPLSVHVPGRGGLNAYAYVDGRVLSSVDPVGLEPFTLLGVGAAILIGAAIGGGVAVAAHTYHWLGNKRRDDYWDEKAWEQIGWAAVRGGVAGGIGYGVGAALPSSGETAQRLIDQNPDIWGTSALRSTVQAQQLAGAIVKGAVASALSGMAFRGIEAGARGKELQYSGRQFWSDLGSGAAGGVVSYVQDGQLKDPRLKPGGNLKSDNTMYDTVEHATAAGGARYGWVSTSLKQEPEFHIYRQNGGFYFSDATLGGGPTRNGLTMAKAFGSYDSAHDVVAEVHGHCGGAPVGSDEDEIVENGVWGDDKRYDFVGNRPGFRFFIIGRANGRNVLVERLRGGSETDWSTFGAFGNRFDMP